MHYITSTALLGFIAGAQAHVTMNTPRIFPGSISSPLSDTAFINPNAALTFPCQKSVTWSADLATNMGLGSTQPLSFTGSAVHGGGSCQISVTYDLTPTKNSVWKVIHSIQGGCPMRDIDGNNGGDPTLVSPSKYSFPVPAGLPAGKAILAWTWFNKIGNREMYMNCAPIVLGGGNARRDENELETRNATQLVERDQAFYSSLPDMFKANVFGPEPDKCHTVEMENLLFPNPGASVETNKDVKPHKGPLESCIGGETGNAPAGQAPQNPAPVPTSAAGPAPTTTKKAAQPTLPGGVFITVDPTRTIAPTQPTTTLATSKKPVVVAPSKPAGSAPPVQATTLTVVPTKATSIVNPPAATGGASGAQSGPCSQEGRWNCIGGSSFQQCASGSWSTPQPLAAGTTCTAGQSDAIDIKAISARDPAPAPAPAPVNKPSQPASKPKTKTIVKKKVIRVNKKHLHRHQAAARS